MIMVVNNRYNHEPWHISIGDRIAQAAIVPVTKAVFQIVDNLSETERGSGGFGHTGI